MFTFNQCKMMMTGAKLHFVKWIPVPMSNWNRLSSSYFYFEYTWYNEDNDGKFHNLQITIETDTEYRIDTDLNSYFYFWTA